MDTKWTKGPWIVDGQFGVRVGDGFINTQNSGGKFALVNEREANADLVAAAPDLYEALKTLQDAARRSVSIENKVWLQVHNALKKAGGE